MDSKQRTGQMIWAWTERRDEKMYTRFERRCAREIESRMAMIQDRLCLMRELCDREREGPPKKSVASATLPHDAVEEESPMRCWGSTTLRQHEQKRHQEVSPKTPVKGQVWNVQLRASVGSPILSAIVWDPGSAKLLAATSIGHLDELTSVSEACC
jgi:hypothetical protein